MIDKTRFLMWTDVTINIYDENINSEIIDKSFEIFEKNEEIFSRFDKNSMLSQLNKNKSLQVNKDFVKVFNLSKFFYKKTNGYFNPLVNLESIWYVESFEKWSFYKKSTNLDLDFNSIKLEKNKIFLNNNQNLDFGWIVKWRTVDLVANFLEDNWIKHFLIDAWWDIYGTSKNEEAFYIQVYDTNKILKIKNKAICTSWTYKRKWEIDWKKYNHILNPITQTSNFNIKLITIVSDYAVIGDVYATSCIAMWEEKSKIFLEKENLESVIVLGK